MIKTIKLSHFRGYRSLELDLAPITVIIGMNSAGKSTLLHALAFLMNGLDLAAGVEPSDESGKRRVDGGALRDVASVYGPWQSLFTQTAGSSADYVAVDALFEGTEISYGSVTARRRPGTHSEIDVQAEVVTSALRQPTARTRPSAALIAHVDTLSHDESYMSDAEFELASRSAMNAGLVRNRLIRLDEQAIERINRTLRTVTNAEIVERTALADAQVGAPVMISFRRDGATFEIGAANHALVSTLALLSAIEMQFILPTTTGERLLLLDEPELHLHPRAQGEILARIANEAHCAGAQIISATHSVDIVRRMWPRRDSAIINIERPFTRVRRLYSQRELLGAFSQTRDLSLFSAVNFLPSRRILLVEGESDETIIHRSAVAYLGTAPHRMARFDAWTRVSLDGVDNIPAPELIERLISSSILPRLGKGDVLMVASVLDRDYDKDPGCQIHRGLQVERIGRVWSRHSIESLFVEVNVLESLLSATLGPSAPPDLVDRIRQAITEADANDDLREGASDELSEVLRRTRQYVGKAANQEARRRVRTNPEIWQRGKDRAEFVLKHIRGTLPVQVQNKVSASIAKVLESIHPDHLRHVILPPEIIALLDDLVSRAPNDRPSPSAPSGAAV